MKTLLWTVVCRLSELTPGRGAAVLLSGGEQAAVFRFDAEQVHALGNRDPFSGANVISRGLLGSHGEALTVASPMYKQRFDLHTGVCLDDPSVTLPVYPVHVRDGVVEIGVE
jgi:nitrite reductase (NADH) small subunit